MSAFQRLSNLQGKVAVIIGGMGQVGFLTAQKLAAQGARVVCIVRRNVEEAKVKVRELPHYSHLHHFVLQADITDSATLKKAADDVFKTAGACHILVNAAGTTRNIIPQNLEELTDEIFDEILQTNLRGVFSAIREFAPMLKATEDGLIVNISSASSLIASHSNVAYGSAKAGLNLLTRSLGKALAPEIRLIAIAPSFLEKPTSGAHRGDGFNEKVAPLIPLRRIGYAEDVANVIEACATTIRYATGSLIVLDGGRTL